VHGRKQRKGRVVREGANFPALSSSLPLFSVRVRASSFSRLLSTLSVLRRRRCSSLGATANPARRLFRESGCPRTQPEASVVRLPGSSSAFARASGEVSGGGRAGGKFRPKLNTGRKTDSAQVPRGKDAKNFDKRVKRT